MVVRLSHDVFCDFCGDWTHSFVDVNVNRNLAMKKAKKKGWVRYRGRDYCPTCWKETEDDRKAWNRGVRHHLDKGYPASTYPNQAGKVQGVDTGQADGD